MKCLATKADGKRCNRKATVGEYCREHAPSENAIVPISSADSGRWERFMGGEYADRYKNLLSDPNLLRLEDDIALLDIRIGQLVQKAEEGDQVPPASWSKLTRLVDLYKIAEDSGGEKEKNRIMSRMIVEIERGQLDNTVWSEIHSLVGTRSKMVEARHKQYERMQASIPVDRVMGMLETAIISIAEAAHRVIEDPALREMLLLEAQKQYTDAIESVPKS